MKAGALLALAATLLGCGSYGDMPIRCVATNGAVFEGLIRNDTVSKSAVRASSAGDLPCPRDRVSVEKLPGGSRGPTEYTADGCGQRAIYRQLCEMGSDDVTRCHLVLTGRFSLAPAAPVGAP